MTTVRAGAAPPAPVAGPASAAGARTMPANKKTAIQAGRIKSQMRPAARPGETELRMASILRTGAPAEIRSTHAQNVANKFPPYTENKHTGRMDQKILKAFK